MFRFKRKTPAQQKLKSYQEGYKEVLFNFFMGNASKYALSLSIQPISRDPYQQGRSQAYNIILTVSRDMKADDLFNKGPEPTIYHELLNQVQ